MENEQEKQILSEKNGGFIPVSKWNEVHRYPSVGTLRHLIFNKDKNGFEKVLRKVGRRLYICEKDFFAWIDNNKIAV